MWFSINLKWEIFPSILIHLNSCIITSDQRKCGNFVCPVEHKKRGGRICTSVRLRSYTIRGTNHCSQRCFDFDYQARGIMLRQMFSLLDRLAVSNGQTNQLLNTLILLLLIHCSNLYSFFKQKRTNKGSIPEKRYAGPTISLTVQFSWLI